jgi:hypothetical protein
MFNPGKKKRIERWLDGEPVLNGVKYFKKAELSCGHIVDVSIGLSINHRRSRPILYGRCMECWQKENKV